jgi:hypothetical protein
VTTRSQRWRLIALALTSLPTLAQAADPPAAAPLPPLPPTATAAPPVYPLGYPPAYPPGYPPGYQPAYPPGYPPGYPVAPPAGAYPLPPGTAYPYPYPPYPYTPPGYTPPPPAPKETRVEHYHTPILVMDGIAGAGFLAGTLLRTWDPIVLSVTAYWFTGPIVHWTNDRVGIGFASMGMRMGVPFVGLTLASPFCLGQIGEDDALARCERILATGFLVGMVATTAIDAGVFARKTVAVEAGPVSMTPTLNPQRGGATLGLAGQW